MLINLGGFTRKCQYFFLFRDQSTHWEAIGQDLGKRWRQAPRDIKTWLPNLAGFLCRDNKPLLTPLHITINNNTPSLASQVQLAPHRQCTWTVSRKLAWQVKCSTLCYRIPVCSLKWDHWYEAKRMADKRLLRPPPRSSTKDTLCRQLKRLTSNSLTVPYPKMSHPPLFNNTPALKHHPPLPRQRRLPLRTSICRSNSIHRDSCHFHHSYPNSPHNRRTPPHISNKPPHPTPHSSFCDRWYQ